MRDTYSAAPIRGHAQLMPLDSYRPSAWLLTAIEVAPAHRGKGVARQLMRQVLADADTEAIVLCLSIEPDGTGLDEDQLVDWYKRLGFAFERGDDLYCGMVREPRGVSS